MVVCEREIELTTRSGDTTHTHAHRFFEDFSPKIGASVYECSGLQCMIFCQRTARYTACTPYYTKEA